MSASAGGEVLLGSGQSGAAILKRAVRSVHAKLIELVHAGKKLQKGTLWKTELGPRPFLALCSELFGIHEITVRRYIKQVDKAAKQKGEVAEPKKRGKKPLTEDDVRKQHPDLFATVSNIILNARKDGCTVYLDKLLVHVNAELGDEDQLTYDGLRYYMLRMGFTFGRISKTIKSGRTKAYVLSWLVRYCTARCSELRAGAKGERLASVDCFLDECGLYQNESGNWSWFLDDRTWSRGKGPSNKWGIVQCMFAWWGREQNSVAAKKTRKSKRLKEAAAAAGNLGKVVRRFGTFDETMFAWQAKKDGSKKKENAMNGAKFQVYFRDLCEFCKDAFKGKVITFHMDNAPYHKNVQKLPDFDKLSAVELVNWIVQHTDPTLGLGDFDAFVDEDGELPARGELVTLAEEHTAADPCKIASIAGEFGYNVEWTAPMWPQCMPQELYWGNMKGDYRGWDLKDKKDDVEKSVRLFDMNVEERDVRGWVEKTDKFCQAVVDKDADTLGELVVSLLH